MLRQTTTNASLSAVLWASIVISLGCTNNGEASSAPPIVEAIVEASTEREPRGVTFTPPRDQPKQDPEPRPQLSAEQAEAHLREVCASQCGRTVNRRALVYRVALARRDDEARSSIVESARAAHPEPTEAQEQGFMDFARGGPGVILTRSGVVDFNPERVDLDGTSGQAIFFDENDRVVACMSSDPELLPTAVRVDCGA